MSERDCAKEASIDVSRTSVPDGLQAERLLVWGSPPQSNKIEITAGIGTAPEKIADTPFANPDKTAPQFGQIRLGDKVSIGLVSPVTPAEASLPKVSIQELDPIQLRARVQQQEPKIGIEFRFK